MFRRRQTQLSSSCCHSVVRVRSSLAEVQQWDEGKQSSVLWFLYFLIKKLFNHPVWSNGATCWPTSSLRALRTTLSSLKLFPKHEYISNIKNISHKVDTVTASPVFAYYSADRWRDVTRRRSSRSRDVWRVPSHPSCRCRVVRFGLNITSQHAGTPWTSTWRNWPPEPGCFSHELSR